MTVEEKHGNTALLVGSRRPDGSALRICQSYVRLLMMEKAGKLVVGKEAV